MLMPASLLSGIEFVAVAIGLFRIGEVLINVEKPSEMLEQKVLVPRLRELYPTVQDFKKSIGPILRGAGIGFGVGLVPGPAPVIATDSSYMVERKISKYPEEFGKGAIQGVAGPESANNSACQSAFIPLFVLGIPFAPPTAILLGALLIHGVSPGPMLIGQHPQLFWGVIASMYIGNFILLILNLPFVPLFANMLRIPKRVLLPLAPEEVEEVLFNDENIPLMMRGKEGKYLAYGKTRGGRLLFILWASKYKKTRIITARDMTEKEKRFYRRRKK